MISALKNLFAAKKEAPCSFSGTGAILMAGSREIAKLSERVSPVELIEHLNRVTTTLIRAVEKNGGVVHVHVGGSLVAYWPPSTMPAGAGRAISAALDAVASCGTSVAVSVAIAEFALADVGPATAKRPMLVGAAYQRAEAALHVSRSGVVAVDFQTLDVLPADIQARFVRKDEHAELE